MQESVGDAQERREPGSRLTARGADKDGMGKLLAILLLLAAIQLGWTVYNEGLSNAYGGVLAPLAGEQPTVQRSPQVSRSPRADSQNLRRTGRPGPGSVAHGMRDRVDAAMGNRRRGSDGD
jgi:hypothetical protein